MLFNLFWSGIIFIVIFVCFVDREKECSQLFATAIKLWICILFHFQYIVKFFSLFSGFLFYFVDFCIKYKFFCIIFFIFFIPPVLFSVYIVSMSHFLVAINIVRVCCCCLAWSHKLSSIWLPWDAFSSEFIDLPLFYMQT